MKFSNTTRKYRSLVLLILISLFYFFTPQSIQASQTSKLYVSNGADNYISVIDPISHNLVNTIPVGDQPRKIVNLGNKIYASNFTGHSITVINQDTASVISTIPLGNIYPERLFISNDGNRLYTGDPWLTEIAVIDTATNSVIKTLSGFNSPQESAENKLGTRLYVINQNSSSTNGYVSVLDTSDYSTIANITVGYEPMTIAVTPDGKKAYVGNNGGANRGNTVSVIDTNTNNSIKTITVGINPYDIEINSTGTRVYVMNTFYWDNQSGSTISVIDTATDTVIATIPVGDVANSITLSADGSKLYVTKDHAGTVDVISTTTNTIIDTIPAGNHPWGVAELSQESNDLSVPVLKQTSDPWQANVYDSADEWSPLTPTINNWGCALTSEAMLLRYYGINRLPDNTLLDPGSLNTWLKNHNGYVRGSVNWLAIPALAKAAKASGFNPDFAYDTLEFQWIKQYNPEQLTTDLEKGQPDILEEPGHYIVAKGINGDTFSINDPFYTRSLLTDGYNNSFLSMRRYVPANSDLSYIMLVTDQTTDVSLEDNSGTNLGQTVIEQPITDPLTSVASGLPFKLVLFPKPQTDNYKIVLHGSNDQVYTISTYLYDKDGNVKVDTLQGTILSGNSETADLKYDKEQTDSSSISKSISYQTTRNDITALQSVEQITKDSIAKKLTHLIDQAEDAEQKDMLDQRMKRLDAFQSEVETDRNNDILDNATTILLQDVAALKYQ